MAWSSVAQAGYMLAGVVVATRLGVQATVFYLAVYLMMNLAAFAVIVIRERETSLGDDIASVQGLGAERPLLALPMTLAMLGLSGIPATAGFIGKFYLIDATVSGDYTWLGVVIVIGSMVSLAYYLKVIAAMWMQDAPTPGAALATTGHPAMAGGSAEADGASRFEFETWFVALVFGGATLFFGIVPSPLFDLAVDAGRSLSGLF
jgi:NADH-quinone oxidoreductase subunit N